MSKNELNITSSTVNSIMESANSMKGDLWNLRAKFLELSGAAEGKLCAYLDVPGYTVEKNLSDLLTAFSSLSCTSLLVLQIAYNERSRLRNLPLESISVDSLNADQYGSWTTLDFHDSKNKYMIFNSYEDLLSAVYSIRNYLETLGNDCRRVKIGEALSVLDQLIPTCEYLGRASLLFSHKFTGGQGNFNPAITLFARQMKRP